MQQPEHLPRASERCSDRPPALAAVRLPRGVHREGAGVLAPRVLSTPKPHRGKTATGGPEKSTDLEFLLVGWTCLRRLPGSDPDVSATLPSRPGGVSPRAAHRSGRDTLASSGSCPRTKTAAFRREMRALPVVSWPALNVGDLPPLLHGHYPASLLLQSSPPLPAASVLSASQVRCLYLFPWPRWTASQVPYESQAG